MYFILFYSSRFFNEALDLFHETFGFLITEASILHGIDAAFCPILLGNVDLKLFLLALF
jgi:hypothetical protein